MYRRFHSGISDFSELGSIGAGILASLPAKGIEDSATDLFSMRLVKSTLAEAARQIVNMAAAREMVTIQFVNAHCVNVALKDGEYRAALEFADLLLPDGSGMAIAARMTSQELGGNLNGTDLFPELCREAVSRKQSIYLLGGQPGIATAVGSRMSNLFPALRIAGTRNGFWSGSEEDQLIEEINASGADILLVGLGVPLQEKWIMRVRDRLTARVVMGVGGLFDYYSGSIPRAPLVLRKMGCEWLWRLMQEPRRLFARYILGNPLFVMAAARNAWRNSTVAASLSDGLKRAFDLTVALATLVATLPVLLLVALAIKLEDGGPVFFQHIRIGADGRPFKMWKFRSMVVDAEARLAAIKAQSERDGTCFKMRHDPRITRVGALLRRLSLDELPQILNVVLGEMSIVGPRPALPREVLTYDPSQRERLQGQPGLTCTWQVSGRAEIPFLQQVEMDVEYLRNRSFLRDLGLILRTIPAVLTARGAY